MAFLGKFYNAKVTLNAVDLSDHVKSVSISYSAEELDDTVMGDTAKSRLPGLLDWSAEIEFVQDYANSKVDLTLFPLVGAAPFTVAIMPISGSKTANTPSFEGSGILTSYRPLGGTVGELLTAPVTIMGDGALSRVIA